MSFSWGLSCNGEAERGSAGQAESIAAVSGGWKLNKRETILLLVAVVKKPSRNRLIASFSLPFFLHVIRSFYQ